jgi:hypothetical protein
MIESLRTTLLCIAAASFIANGAHSVMGSTATESSARPTPADVNFVEHNGLVSSVTFRVSTSARSVRIRVSANGSWYPCDMSGSSVRCAISARPVSEVKRLELRTV